MQCNRRPPRRPAVRYELSGAHEDWILTEDKVPQSRPHDRAAESVFAQLDAMVKRKGRDAVVCRELAVRWDEDHPSLGFDPDVCLLDPPPPEREQIESLLLWKAGHFPPALAVEIVSASRPGKDYSQSPEKCAVNGTEELWVFDPNLVGPKSASGPVRLQVWRRDSDEELCRVYAGNGPAWSEMLQAWAHVTNDGQMLRIADDKKGTSWWLTREEEERAAAEKERAAAAKERAAKEQAQRRAERLAARLLELGVDPGAE